MNDGLDERERRRLDALDRYKILDTAPQEAFEDIVALAAQICGMPMALISLVDDKRQWFKARIGLDATETPRNIAFCAHAIGQHDVMVVNDATQDERFAENPLVTGDLHLRFYAGAPLETPDGHSLGTLCVLDSEPREITIDQKRALERLAKQVITQLELRSALDRQGKVLRELEESEARARLALEAGEFGAWQSTPALGEMSWDARTRELLGHFPDEPLDYETSFLARVHPEDRDHVVAANAAALGPDGDGTTDMHYRTISAVDGRERWIHAKGAVARNRDGQDRFVGTVRDITAEKDAEAHRRLLTRELEHRIKNTLAVVQAIVSQSLRNVATPEEARDAIGERLRTLSHAHDLLTQASWTAAPMAMIVEGATRLHGAKPGRILIKGPDIQLSAKAALAFSMSLHELSTNAAKYGALSNEVGHVELTWSIDGDQLLLRWQEYGGPPVNPPSRTGFGSRLMTGLERDMGGKATLDYQPDGVVWVLRATLSRIAAEI